MLVLILANEVTETTGEQSENYSPHFEKTSASDERSVELITARRVAVSIRIFDLETRALVWEGVVEESESESRTYSPQRPDNAGEFCLSIPLEIMLEDVYQPPAPSTETLLTKIFRTFAQIIP